MIKVKRVYDSQNEEDGIRILVDRLWPRGLSKEKAKVDLWLKELAPSSDLRNWFNHEPYKWYEFKRRYYAELEDKKLILKLIHKEVKKQNVTLLYSSREEKYNDAMALKQFILKYH
ncbi:MAG: hypothetical protein UT64_C0016G0005 [Candidatus Falkowbacteria bacterium GW2011_GWF2_39_8]|uniref:Uroporphyrin-III C-methyltransferase n=1 Tax=Candidatus Falkowbacteria bacterium GW2011_GWF2_39_8 TaxID=1618642 RepID=A0A0G0PYN4_9BACT|nr:MAG: hypothetical protein UT64_C0016G0005 [Candidatus Falkowbacteria bacterium GW2011_GWF2_39_8]